MLEHGLMSNYQPSQVPGTYSPDLLNVRVDQHSIKGRYGHSSADRALAAKTYAIAMYKMAAGTTHTLYLTDEDLCAKETSGSNTFSYKTETYTTGTVTNITGAVITGSGTSWDTSGLAAGDKIIVDTDHSSAIEVDANWGEIQTVDNATQITLTANYTGTTGAMSDTYKGRMVYSVPTNERWSYVLMNDIFYFTNGNVDVQSWAGTGYASAVDSTYAKQARYCIEYANRLVLADLLESSVRDPYLVQWSKENDPTDWTDSTAGAQALLDSEDYITGLGKVGANLIVYRRESINVGSRTGEAFDPLAFPIYRRGIGCVAPWSIVEVMGTNAFLGRDDFYYIEGDTPRPLSRNKARYKFFDLSSPTEAEQTWGFVDTKLNEVQWILDTASGQYIFAWNIQNDEWSMYSYGSENIHCAGRGAK